MSGGNHTSERRGGERLAKCETNRYLGFLSGRKNNRRDLRYFPVAISIFYRKRICTINKTGQNESWRT